MDIGGGGAVSGRPLHGPGEARVWPTTAAGGASEATMASRVFGRTRGLQTRARSVLWREPHAGFENEVWEASDKGDGTSVLLLRSGSVPARQFRLSMNPECVTFACSELREIVCSSVMIAFIGPDVLGTKSQLETRFGQLALYLVSRACHTASFIGLILPAAIGRA